jgi:hypothetical protein
VPPPHRLTGIPAHRLTARQSTCYATLKFAEILVGLVRQHLETFLAEARQRGGGAGLPRFVERELREFLTCGVMARGFARFRCDGCAREILVAFSCKGRICPSCCGRHPAPPAAYVRPPYVAWADLLRRVVALDILACPDCGGRLRLLATIADRAVVQTILTHLGLPVALPQPSAARTPAWLPSVREAADHEPDAGGHWAD